MEAERNRKSNRMRDWLANRNMREDRATYGNASGVCLDANDQDVVQNVGEIVASFALELEEQQPGKVNEDWQTLEEETLVSKDKEDLADRDQKRDIQSCGTSCKGFGCYLEGRSHCGEDPGTGQ